MPKQVLVKLSTVGQDAGPFTITNDVGETLATGVTKVNLANGISYSMLDTAATVTITSTGTCTNNVTIPIEYLPPTPTQTITPTIQPTLTATITPSGTATSGPVTLTLGFVKQAHRFTAQLSQTIGVDIYVRSIYVDGYEDSNCVNARASASDIRNILVLPAGNTNYNWSPQTICGGLIGNTSCWLSATHYTTYNVNVNGATVSHGSTINIGGVDVLVNFPSCRQL